MKRALAVMLVMGCADPVAPPQGDPPDLTPPRAGATAGGAEVPPVPPDPNALHLVAIEPNMLPQHGGDVLLDFTGDWPADAWIEVDGYWAGYTGSTSPLSLHINGGFGTISILVADSTHVIASLPDAGSFIADPADVSLAFDLNDPFLPDTLAVPLHPELARACVRAATVLVTNNGDAPAPIDPVFVGSSGFAATPEPANPCGTAIGHGTCALHVCFGGTATPGVNAAQLHVANASLDVTATVLPAATDLDPTFATTGVVTRPYVTPYQEVPAGMTIANDGASVIVWDSAPSRSFQVFAPDGTAVTQQLGDVPQLEAGGFLTLMHGSPSGIYVIASYGENDQNVLVRFDTTGLRDPWFAAGYGAVVLDADFYRVRAAIEVQSTGRVVVIGGTTARGFTADGLVDPTWGGGGATGLPATAIGATVIDADDRIYVATSQGVMRLGADGTIDPAFTYAGAVDGLVFAQDAVYVSGGGALSRLDAGGTATTLAPLAQRTFELVVDASGNFYGVTQHGDVVELDPSGALVGTRGFEGGMVVACPDTGGCWVSGLAGMYVSGAVWDKYLLRLAP